MGSDDEGPQELEQVTGLALSLASLPGVEVSLRALDDDDLPDAGVHRQSCCHICSELQNLLFLGCGKY